MSSQVEILGKKFNTVAVAIVTVLIIIPLAIITAPLWVPLLAIGLVWFKLDQKKKRAKRDKWIKEHTIYEDNGKRITLCESEVTVAIKNNTGSISSCSSEPLENIAWCTDHINLVCAINKKVQDRNASDNQFSDSSDEEEMVERNLSFQ